MPLFMCETCRCIENTACCNYWFNKSHKKALQCSACDPTVGQWHGVFPQRPATGMLIDELGHLWSKSAVDAGQLPAHYKIVGEVK
jgi:hypothetical protein